jgi:hypothetical protein
MKESGGNLSCFLNLGVKPFGLGGPLCTLRSGCRGYGACLMVQCTWRFWKQKARAMASLSVG